MKMIGGSFRRSAAKIAVATCAIAMLTACQSSSSSTHESTHGELAPEDDAPIFSSSIFGVKASPRVTRLKNVRKGGGRDQVGKPYTVRGKWYYPKEEPGYVKSGTASWYGANFHGRLTANGEVYDMYHLSAAHPTFPLPSYARVTNKKTGSSVTVRVNDRGPYVHNRVLDVSSKAAEMLGFQNQGVADVKVEYIGRAPLEGDDTSTLMASYRPGAARPIDDGLASGVMIASRAERAAPLLVASAFASQKSTSQLPGVKPMATTPSIEDLIGNYDIGTSAPMSAPIPTLRTNVLSYASSASHSGAAAALSSLTSGAASTDAGERIEIGLVDDLTLLTRIYDLANDHADVSEEDGEGGTALALQMKVGENADDMLTKLWRAGATDAFVLKN